MKFTAYIAFGLALISLAGCGSESEISGGSGLIETDEVIVSAESSGKIMQLDFSEGSSVSTGDTLAVIDPSRIVLEIESARAGRMVAQANLAVSHASVEQTEQTRSYAKSELERITRLLNSGTATRKQFDAMEFEHKQAVIALSAAKATVATTEAEIVKIDAEIARLERRLEDSYPVAPISGTVLEKYVDLGEVVAAGSPLAKIARMDTVWVKVYLSLADFAKVKLGDKAKVDTETESGTFEGEVVWTSDEAEFTPKNVQTKESRADLVYAVKVRVANTDGTLKIGMPVFITMAE